MKIYLIILLVLFANSSIAQHSQEIEDHITITKTSYFIYGSEETPDQVNKYTFNQNGLVTQNISFDLNGLAIVKASTYQYKEGKLSIEYYFNNRFSFEDKKPTHFYKYSYPNKKTILIEGNAIMSKIRLHKNKKPLHIERLTLQNNSKTEIIFTYKKKEITEKEHYINKNLLVKKVYQYKNDTIFQTYINDDQQSYLSRKYVTHKNKKTYNAAYSTNGNLKSETFYIYNKNGFIKESKDIEYSGAPKKNKITGTFKSVYSYENDILVKRQDYYKRGTEWISTQYITFNVSGKIDRLNAEAIDKINLTLLGKQTNWRTIE